MATVPDEYAVIRNLTDTIINRAVAGTLRGMTGYISEFTRLLNTQVGDKKDIRQANERIATEARNAAVRRYDQRRALSDVGEYRAGQGRVSGGRLRRAIDSNSFARGDDDGIAVGNLTTLNKEAAHWARINYSNGPQATVPNPIPVRFDNVEIARFTPKVKAKPLWSIPQGSFFIGGEMHIFRHGGMSARQVNKAHRPYHFIEEGFEEAAQRVGPEYETIMFGWLNKSGQEAKNFKGKTRFKGVYIK